MPDLIDLDAALDSLSVLSDDAEIVSRGDHGLTAGVVRALVAVVRAADALGEAWNDWIECTAEVEVDMPAQEIGDLRAALAPFQKEEP